MKSRFVLIALLATAPCLVQAQVTQSELRQRRDSVLARTGDGIVLALGSPEPAEDYFSFFHGLGHDIGLDVHDPMSGSVTIGSAFTIEPGVYVRANTLEIIPDTPANRSLREKIGATVGRYRNIGVRIEDDYIVTEQGLEWVSRAPRENSEIEALMNGPFTGPAPRDPTKVEWYRGTGR